MLTHNQTIQKLKTLASSHAFTVDRIKTLDNKKSAAEKEAERLRGLVRKLENLNYTCKLVLEKITYSNKAKLEEFLTTAVKHIFTDRDYVVELIIKEDTKRPGLELTLTEGGIQQEITDAVGGGIISTLGLLLQIYYIEVYKLNKIMFIDEGLKEVSTGTNSDTTESINYLDNLLRFLQWLAETKSYSLVIVTHDNTVRKFASQVYEVDRGRLIQS